MATKKVYTGTHRYIQVRTASPCPQRAPSVPRRASRQLGGVVGGRAPTTRPWPRWAPLAVFCTDSYNGSKRQRSLPQNCQKALPMGPVGPCKPPATHGVGAPQSRRGPPTGCSWPPGRHPGTPSLALGLPQAARGPHPATPAPRHPGTPSQRPVAPTPPHLVRCVCVTRCFCCTFRRRCP